MRQWRELVNTKQQVVAVCRNSEQYQSFSKKFPGWRYDINTGGFFTVRQAFANARVALSEILYLYRECSDLCHMLFMSIIKLPFRRSLIKALLNKYEFQYFWSRDDYNVEHIIRTQELRVIGAKSLGLLHGIAMRNSAPLGMLIMIYYTFGDDLYNQYYKESWAA